MLFNPNYFSGLVQADPLGLDPEGAPAPRAKA
jgi:hypothetical protein